MASSTYQNLIAAAFPGVVLRTVDIDPELPGDVIEAFMIPDDQLAQFCDFVECLSIERVRGGGSPVVVVPHTTSWTRTHAPSLSGGGSPGAD
jgi:hypothetical protein